MNLREIAMAWTNAIVRPEDKELLATERMKICDGCEFRTKELVTEVCAACHCPLFAKIYSPYNSCPKNKWPA